MLASFYERDIQKLMDEISQFQNEENIWRTTGSIQNSSGNLVLHFVGGMHYFIGNLLTNNGYIRNREEEFTTKNIARHVLLSDLQKIKTLVVKTISDLNQEQMEASFPIAFDNANNSVQYVLTQLLIHLNYHLGQINYLRRILEPNPEND